jgi:hypothetical protein
MQGAGGAQAYGRCVQASNPRTGVRSKVLQGHDFDCVVLCYARMIWDIALRTTVLLHTGCSTRPSMADGSYHGMDSESQDTDRPALPFDIRWSDYRHRYRVVLPADSRRYDDTMPCPEGVRDLTSGQQSASASNMTHWPYLHRKPASWSCMPVVRVSRGTYMYSIACPCHASEMGMDGNAARTPCL